MYKSLVKFVAKYYQFQNWNTNCDGFVMNNGGCKMIGLNQVFR